MVVTGGTETGIETEAAGDATMIDRVVVVVEETCSTIAEVADATTTDAVERSATSLHNKLEVVVVHPPRSANLHLI